jgi:putative MATE family efflux protein
LSEETVQSKQAERYDMMINWPMHRVVPKIAIPSIISMMVSMFYNMADTYFVSKINTAATAAVGINVSLMFIIQAIGMTFGAGCMSYISRLLGQKNRDRASKAISTGFFSTIVISTVFAVVSLIFLNGLMHLLGATETILPYSRDYGSYILLGAPFIAASFVMDSALRGEGLSKIAMIGVTTGAVLNVFLDPLFIFTFKLGVAGAAIATIIGQIVSFFILLTMYLKHKSLLHLSARNVTLEGEMFKEIFKIGFPSFIRVALNSLATITMNWSAGAFGDAAIAAMSVHTRIVMFGNAALIGLGQGYSPVAGYNYGAKRFDRVWKSFWFTITTAEVGMFILSTLLFIFAPNLMMLFRPDDTEVIRIGTMALRFNAISIPLQALNVISNMTFSALGHGFQAGVMALSRQGLFFIPAALILPKILGVTGVALIPSVADASALIVTLVLMLPFKMKLNRARKEMPGFTAEAEEV